MILDLDTRNCFMAPSITQTWTQLILYQSVCYCEIVEVHQLCKNCENRKHKRFLSTNYSATGYLQGV